jgi:hypothetical protein
MICGSVVLSSKELLRTKIFLQGDKKVQEEAEEEKMDFRKLIGSFGTDVLILLVIGVVMMFNSAGDMVVSFKPAVSFEDMFDGKEVKAGSHVAGDVLFVMDYFASESTYTRRSDGSRSGDKANGNYYMIPMAEGDKYIGLKSRQVDVADLDRLTEETYNFLIDGTEMTTQVFMEGTVEVMESELVQYFREYLADMGYTESEIDAMGEPLVIQYRSFTAVRVLFIIGLALTALAVFFVCRRYRRE